MVALDAFYPMTGVTEQLAQWQNFAPYYFADGVIQGVLNSCAVLQHAPPGMSVDVGTGYAFIQGVYGQNGSTKNLAISAANATNPRIDRVVLRVDTVAQDMEVLVLTGTAAASPSAPAIVRSATQTDYSLAQILVNTTVTSIVTANITDERQYASPRGIPSITSLASSGTINPYTPTPLTDGWGIAQVSGTTTISNIATGNLPPQGTVLMLSFLSAGCQVGTGGNLNLARPYISGVAQKAALLLRFDGGVWIEMGRSGEQAPAHQYFGNPTGTVAAATFAAIVAADLPAYGSATMGSLTQGVGVAYTPTGVRSTQLGKLYHLHGQIAPTGTGTAGSLVNFQFPSGVTANMNSGEPLGTWRIDGANSYTGVLSVGGGGTSMNFHMPLNPGAFWGVTPNVSLNNTTTVWFNITIEVN
ncbi:MAG: hypothetical protein V4510_12505 [bacterium]